eukprot:TRINITY_DN1395_c0_g2_i1.p1 TRINITY_DN1395_c0_g2~~TRINITY_DN1395_c0_g2_i1.p1  ORF type:complete len:150 (+),score=28.63 TRINITY_DN1395_c0_g2_i1:131-580(+)
MDNAEQPPDIFLGGTCGDSLWRTDVAIPILEPLGLSFYNPQLPAGQWTPELIPVEGKAKEGALCQLYIITGESRGIASMVEAAELITSGRNTVLCMQKYEGEGEDCKDVNRGRKYLQDLAQRRNCTVYECVEEATREAVRRIQSLHDKQ